jgi:hypothetical protein
MEAFTVVNNGGARAIAMDTSTAKSAAVEASTSKATTAAAMATAATATTARQRHGRRGQANGCNSQQCKHFSSQDYHSPSESRRIDHLPAAALASLPAQPVPDPLVNVGKCESV